MKYFVYAAPGKGAFSSRPAAASGRKGQPSASAALAMYSMVSMQKMKACMRLLNRSK